MDLAHLAALKEWFGRFVAGYLDLDPEAVRNIRLKELHTAKVLEAMELLTAGESMSPAESRLACAIALLHDVGRFPQYRRWRTFRDSESDNHARLGIEVIRAERLLEPLPAAERLLIEEAVRFHNLLQLPPRLRSCDPRFARLIRDADKLDIWRVFVEYFQQPEQERASAAGLGFPDLPEVTPACVESLASGRIVRLSDCRFLNDFRLLQLSWVYDLNFTTSYRLLAQRNYLPVLAAGIPDAPGVGQAVAAARDYLRHRGG